MLKLRLQRIGRRNDPSYRVIVCDSRQGPKSGKFIDLLGSYNPKMDTVKIDGEKVRDWIAKGVQVSPTVHNLLIGQKIIEGKKINVLPKKSPIIAEKTDEDGPALSESEDLTKEEIETKSDNEEIDNRTESAEGEEEGVKEETAETKEVEADKESEDPTSSDNDELENAGVEKKTESDTTEVDTDEDAGKKAEAKA